MDEFDENECVSINIYMQKKKRMLQLARLTGESQKEKK